MLQNHITISLHTNMSFPNPYSCAMISAEISPAVVSPTDDVASGFEAGAMICTLMTSAAADTDAFRDGGRAIGSFADMS